MLCTNICEGSTQNVNAAMASLKFLINENEFKYLKLQHKEEILQNIAKVKILAMLNEFDVQNVVYKVAIYEYAFILVLLHYIFNPYDTTVIT